MANSMHQVWFNTLHAAGKDREGNLPANPNSSAVGGTAEAVQLHLAALQAFVQLVVNNQHLHSESFAHQALTDLYNELIHIQIGDPEGNQYVQTYLPEFTAKYYNLF